MADSVVQVAPDSTGKKIDVSELTVGVNTVERQRIVITDDAGAAALGKVTNASPASTDYGLVTRAAGDGLVVLSGATVSGTATLATQDTTGGYSWWQIQLAGTFSFTLLVEVSDDNANWQSTTALNIGNTFPNSVFSTFTAAGQWYGLCRSRYVRVRCSAFTSSASGAVTFVLRSTSPPVEYVNVNALGNVNITGTRGISSLAVGVTPLAASAATDFTSARVASAATTNATSVKGSAGNLYGGFLSNTSASAKFVKFYNKATAPTVGTDTPIWTCLVPAGQTVPLTMDMNPLRFGTGLAYAITGLVADSDTTAVAVNDVIGFLNYA